MATELEKWRQVANQGIHIEAKLRRENLMLTQENTRLWERIKELQQPVKFEFECEGHLYSGEVAGPTHVVIKRWKPEHGK